MKILFPQNVFSSMLVESLPQELADQISYVESARLYNELEHDNCDAALIPTLELIKNKDLFVSKKMCMAFYSYVCNSFVYFAPDQQELEKVSVMGDMSAHDVLIAKYLFAEMYGKEIEINLLTEKHDSSLEKNLCVVGDKNFTDMQKSSALSIAEEISEMTSFPYVNYILASKSGVTLSEIESKIDDLNVSFDENLEKIMAILSLPPEAKELIEEQSGSFSFNVGENEEHGINELLRLPYFYGTINDIIEVKFV